MCSDPVTLGGGITIENGALGAAASAWKYFLSSHSSYQRFSRVEGS